MMSKFLNSKLVQKQDRNLDFNNAQVIANKNVKIEIETLDMMDGEDYKKMHSYLKSWIQDVIAGKGGTSRSGSMLIAAINVNAENFKVNEEDGHLFEDAVKDRLSKMTGFLSKHISLEGTGILFDKNRLVYSIHLRFSEELKDDIKNKRISLGNFSYLIGFPD